MKPTTGEAHYWKQKYEDERQQHLDLQTSIELYWEPTRDAQRKRIESYEQWFKDREYVSPVQETK